MIDQIPRAQDAEQPGLGCPGAAGEADLPISEAIAGYKIILGRCGA
jgi:hypothetical protein